MSDFFDFRTLLPKAVARYNMNRETQAAQVCERFRRLSPAILTEPIAAEPKFFKNGTLYISVKTSIDAQRVFTKRHDLMEALNKDFDKHVVKDLRSLIG